MADGHYAIARSDYYGCRVDSTAAAENGEAARGVFRTTRPIRQPAGLCSEPTIVSPFLFARNSGNHISKASAWVACGCRDTGVSCGTQGCAGRYRGTSRETIEDALSEPPLRSRDACAAVGSDREACSESGSNVSRHQ